MPRSKGTVGRNSARSLPYELERCLAGQCAHERFITTPSSHADIAGYRQAEGITLAKATRPKGSSPTLVSEPGLKGNVLVWPAIDGSSQVDALPEQRAFPAPLVLPHDDLAIESDYEPQSFQDWLDLGDSYKNRFEGTKRRILYVADAPRVGDGLEFVSAWTQSQQHFANINDINGVPPHQIPQPRTADVVEYLSAFYHGVHMKQLDGKLEYTPWPDEAPRAKRQKRSQKLPDSTSPTYIGLNIGSEIVRIRTRCPPNHCDQTFPYQLNLNDILDAGISALPKDAYALLLIVHHDLYEDEDDDFCCGRAYGGSRIAVVSTARYRPGLHDSVGADPEALHSQHIWPLAHCLDYMRVCCQDYKDYAKALTSKPPKHNNYLYPQALRGVEAELGPLGSAILAFIEACEELPGSERQTSEMCEYYTGTWLADVCKTASHELGHCFGFDHCVYYACIMQGTASVIEDRRQPPYLCPVDLAKLLNAIQRLTKSSVSIEQLKQQRYHALTDFCEKWPNVRLFRAFKTWLTHVSSS